MFISGVKKRRWLIYSHKRVVLNGIVLVRSTRETVFTDYMTYRAFAGQGRHDASAFTVRRERQSAPGL
jgi:hypothetical protein